MVNLGDEVQDKITGFKGIATSRHQYLQGCDRIGVQGKIGKDGKLPETYTFDEPLLIVIKSKVAKKEKGKNGGPALYIPKEKSTGR